MRSGRAVPPVWRIDDHATDNKADAVVSNARPSAAAVGDAGAPAKSFTRLILSITSALYDVILTPDRIAATPSPVDALPTFAAPAAATNSDRKAPKRIASTEQMVARLPQLPVSRSMRLDAQASYGVAATGNERRVDAYLLRTRRTGRYTTNDLYRNAHSKPLAPLSLSVPEVLWRRANATDVVTVDYTRWTVAHATAAAAETATAAFQSAEPAVRGPVLPQYTVFAAQGGQTHNFEYLLPLPAGAAHPTTLLRRIGAGDCKKPGLAGEFKSESALAQATAANGGVPLDDTWFVLDSRTTQERHPTNNITYTTKGVWPVASHAFSRGTDSESHAPLVPQRPVLGVGRAALHHEVVRSGLELVLADSTSLHVHLQSYGDRPSQMRVFDRVKAEWTALPLTKHRRIDILVGDHTIGITNTLSEAVLLAANGAVHATASGPTKHVNAAVHSAAATANSSARSSSSAGVGLMAGGATQLTDKTVPAFMRVIHGATPLPLDLARIVVGYAHALPRTLWLVTADDQPVDARTATANHARAASAALLAGPLALFSARLGVVRRFPADVSLRRDHVSLVGSPDTVWLYGHAQRHEAAADRGWRSRVPPVAEVIHVPTGRVFVLPHEPATDRETGRAWFSADSALFYYRISLRAAPARAALAAALKNARADFERDLSALRARRIQRAASAAATASGALNKSAKSASKKARSHAAEPLKLRPRTHSACHNAMLVVRWVWQRAYTAVGDMFAWRDANDERAAAATAVQRRKAAGRVWEQPGQGCERDGHEDDEEERLRDAFEERYRSLQDSSPPLCIVPLDALLAHIDAPAPVIDDRVGASPPVMVAEQHCQVMAVPRGFGLAEWLLVGAHGNASLGGETLAHAEDGGGAEGDSKGGHPPTPSSAQSLSPVQPVAQADYTGRARQRRLITEGLTFRLSTSAAASAPLSSAVLSRVTSMATFKVLLASIERLNFAHGAARPRVRGAFTLPPPALRIAHVLACALGLGVAGDRTSLPEMCVVKVLSASADGAYFLAFAPAINSLLLCYLPPVVVGGAKLENTAKPRKPPVAAVSDAPKAVRSRYEALLDADTDDDNGDHHDDRDDGDVGASAAGRSGARGTKARTSRKAEVRSEEIEMALAVCAGGRLWRIPAPRSYTFPTHTFATAPDNFASWFVEQPPAQVSVAWH